VDRVATATAEHRRILAAVDALEAALDGDIAALTPALDAFVAVFDTEAIPHLAMEEANIYPHLASCLPPEVGAIQTMLDDHQTLRSLCDSLGEERAHLEEVRANVLTTARDLALLMRDHIQREERVIFPLATKFLNTEEIDDA